MVPGKQRDLFRIRCRLMERSWQFYEFFFRFGCKYEIDKDIFVLFLPLLIGGTLINVVFSLDHAKLVFLQLWYVHSAFYWFCFLFGYFFLLIATMYILLIGTMNYWKKKKNTYILLIGTTYIFELQKLINVQMISISFPFHSFKLCRPEFIFLCNLKNIKLTGSMHRSPSVYLTTPPLPHFPPTHPCGPKSIVS